MFSSRVVILMLLAGVMAVPASEERPKRSAALRKWATCDELFSTCADCNTWVNCYEYEYFMCKKSDMCPPFMPYCAISDSNVAYCTADKSKSVCP